MDRWVRARIAAGQRHASEVRTLGGQIWRQWRIVMFFVVFVVVPVKSSLADWDWVPTGSMNPTILEGDLIYVNKLAYDLRVPLTLHRLASWSEPQRGVLALEDLGGIIHPVLRIPGIQARRSFGPVVVPPGCYFVLGDSRDVSWDSRYFGVVPREAILGQAGAGVLSLNLTDKYQPRLGRFFSRLR